MAANHATGTAGLLASDELNRDMAGVQGTFGWTVMSGAVTFSSGYDFAVAATAIGDFVVNGVTATAAYAGGTVTLDAADPLLPRIDRIVITSGAAVSVVKGTPRGPSTVYAAPTSGAAATTAIATTGPIPAPLTTSQLEIARIYVTANNSPAMSASSITDRRVPLSKDASLVMQYKSATQVISASTTFVDVITVGGGAVASFYAEASTVYLAQYYIPLTFSGTGGFKAQITGPAIGAGNISITGWAGLQGGASANVARALTEVTAYSSAIAAFNAAGTGAEGTTYENTNASLVEITMVLRNGATAGAVTLQAAQNSANGTTTLGLGTVARVQRML